MRNLLIGGALLAASSVSMAAFISPTTATASNPLSFGSANNLVQDAPGLGGEFAYVAPNPNTGGGGTSNYTVANTTTFTFELGAAYDLDTIYVWDYYTHTPTEWTIKFFAGAGATGASTTQFITLVNDLDVNVSDKTINAFTAVTSVQSVQFTNTNVSTHASKGVGLSEIAFNGSATPLPPAPVPGVTTTWLVSAGFLGLLLTRRRKSASASA